VSRIGKLPIEIPSGVTVNKDGFAFTVKGPKGQLHKQLSGEMLYEIAADNVVIKRRSESNQQRSLHGLTRSLFANMVEGVVNGFSKTLEIQGVGFRAELKGKKLVLHLGFSHPIVFIPPAEIDVTIVSPTELTISGIEKELVGLVAAKIRSLRPPEPYKGKGIRYKDEMVRRKAGKSGKA
jgi:large subunit ribosomal protein L6